MPFVSDAGKMTALGNHRKRARKRAPSAQIFRRSGCCPTILAMAGLCLLLMTAGGCTGGKRYAPTEIPGIDASRLIQTARSQLGACYLPGGCSPASGFDCSGFIQWVFLQQGISLPRQSRDQYQWGRQVNVDQLRRGDLVFFATDKRGVSHVGIYADDGRFIHCSSPKGGVREDKLSKGYWAEHYLGARRILP